MIQMTGNESLSVATAINEAIELDRVGQTKSAIQLLTRVATEFPQAAGLHCYLAWFSLQVGQGAAAVEHGRQAIGLAPTSEKASLVYFQALWKSGYRDQALNEMRRFLTLRPSEEYSQIIKDWGLDKDVP